MSTPDLARLSIDRGAPAVARRRSRRWTWVFTLFVLALGGAAAWTWLRNAPLTVDTVTVANVYPSQSITLLNATGYVVAQRKASVASKATGRLEWLGVLEGSEVKAGEVIARLENRDASAQREQAAANVKVAQANLQQGLAELKDAQSAYQRSSELIGKRYISAAAHDAALARYNKAKAAIAGLEASIAVARANLRAAEVAFDQTVIRAPFDGVVLTRNANVGDTITPFSSALDTKGAVVTMADMDTLEVEADVAESSLARIKVGQPCEIQLDAIPGERFAGIVNRIVPTVDRAKATVLVKIRFEQRDPRVLPDMSAKTAFLERALGEDERAPIVAVARSAIVESAKGAFLYVVRDGKVSRESVETGRKLGESIAVSGVAAGDRVVARPSDRLHDGAAVRIAER